MLPARRCTTGLRRAKRHYSKGRRSLVGLETGQISACAFQTMMMMMMALFDVRSGKAILALRRA